MFKDSNIDIRLDELLNRVDRGVELLAGQGRREVGGVAAHDQEHEHPPRGPDDSTRQGPGEVLDPLTKQGCHDKPDGVGHRALVSQSQFKYD